MDGFSTSAGMLGIGVGAIVSLVGLVVALCWGIWLTATREGVPLVVIASAVGLTLLIAGGVLLGWPRYYESAEIVDYGVLKHAFAAGLVFGASPGIGSVGGVAVGLLCRRRPD